MLRTSEQSLLSLTTGYLCANSYSIISIYNYLLRGVSIIDYIVPQCHISGVTCRVPCSVPLMGYFTCHCSRLFIGHWTTGAH